MIINILFQYQGSFPSSGLILVYSIKGATHFRLLACYYSCEILDAVFSISISFFKLSIQTKHLVSGLTTRWHLCLHSYNDCFRMPFLGKLYIILGVTSVLLSRYWTIPKKLGEPGEDRSLTAPWGTCTVWLNMAVNLT